MSCENFPEPKKEGMREREARERESERERGEGGGVECEKCGMCKRNPVCFFWRENARNCN